MADETKPANNHKQTDILAIDIVQDYNSSNLFVLNRKVINQIVKLFLRMILKNYPNEYDKFSSIYYLTEIRKQLNNELDLIFFRFVFTGNDLEGIDRQIEKDVINFVEHTTGGSVMIDLALNQDHNLLDLYLKPQINFNEVPTPQEYILASFYNMEVLGQAQKTPLKFNQKQLKNKLNRVKNNTP
jgi:hypothetical protein